MKWNHPFLFCSLRYRPPVLTPPDPERRQRPLPPLRPDGVARPISDERTVHRDRLLPGWVAINPVSVGTGAAFTRETRLWGFDSKGANTCVLKPTNSNLFIQQIFFERALCARHELDLATALINPDAMPVFVELVELHVLTFKIHTLLVNFSHFLDCRIP